MDHQNKNAICGPVTCPEDVLKLIFELNVLSESFKPKSRRLPFILSHICKKWRTVALDTPRLWSQIRVKLGSGKSPSIMEYFACMIERVKSMPVEIEIKEGSPNDKWSNLRTDRALNIRKMTLQLKGDDLVHKILLGETSVLTECHLEELELQVQYDHLSHWIGTWQCGTLLDRFPSIHRLSLIGTSTISFAEMEPTLRITFLSLRRMELELQVIFTKFPRLEELVVLEFMDMPDSIQSMNTLENLKRLDMSLGVMLGESINYLACPRLQAVSIYMEDDSYSRFLSTVLSLRSYDVAYPDMLPTLANAAPQLEYLTICLDIRKNSLHGLVNPESPLFSHLRVLEIQDWRRCVDLNIFEELVCARCLPDNHLRSNRLESVTRLERLEFVVFSTDVGEHPWVTSELYMEAEKAVFPHDDIQKYPRAMVVRLWWRG